jgi:small-conductance mechanosensitive channel
MASMTRGRAILIGIPAAVLLICLAASYLTRGAMANLPFLKGENTSGANTLVDQRPWQTASALAPLAVSTEEKNLALEAERLADHEVDQAFAMALRQASMESRVLTGNALALQQKVEALSELVKEDQARVDGLTTQLAAATKAGTAAANSLTDDLDFAKAQLQLDTDELNDASDDLARESGDKRTRIQQEMTAREAAMKKYDDQAASGGQVAVISAKRYTTFAGRIEGWLDQRSRQKLLQEAQAEAAADVAALSAQHNKVEAKSTAAKEKMGAVGSANAPVDSGAKGKMAAMASMHTLAEIHSIVDDRMATEQQLAAVYAKWIAQVNLQHRILRHLILQSLAAIAAILLVGVLAWGGAQALLDQKAATPGTDARSLHTLRTITNLGIELATLLLILLLIFGAPSQVPTILGLMTAGLTVVFQDFILAFFGWFILMGKNGIRVGDWVEINGVGGEVVEIGIFRTSLLETGNWTDKGHPTGRRVSFINNYAVTGQYFNFSTTGQWMWDEISVNVPSGEDTHKTIEEIHKVVLAQTDQDAKLAETEWKTSTKHQGLGQFSATPSVDMRPAASGIDVLVRYVTRAGDRFEMRNKLYESVIGLLHKSAAVAKS